MYREIDGAKPMTPRTLVIEDSQKVTGGQRQGLTFHHGLNRPPLVVQIQFSPDSAFDDVHILQWPYEYSNCHGPVSIRADTQNVYLEFTTRPLLGVWRHDTAQWATYNEGYFRVIVF